MPASTSYTSLSPLSFLARSAQVWPERLAITYRDRRLSYAEFKAEAERVAVGLQRLGIRPGDRVAYLMPNLPELLIAHFAVPLAGGVLVALNTRLAPVEVAAIVAHSGARVLVADAALGAAARQAATVPTLEHLVILSDGAATDPETAPGSGVLDYAEFRAGDGSLPDSAWVVADELAALSINYTSGTTGRPKGVVYTHRGAYLNSLGEIVHSGFDADTSYLWTLPMFHCNGWCTTWAVTAAGGTHVCLREVRGDAIWDRIASDGVTHLNAAPTVIGAILESAPQRTLAHPIVITTAGAPPSPAVIERSAAMGFRIVHVYGLTETYGPYTVCQPRDEWSTASATDRARFLARQGVAMIQSDPVRVVDALMGDVPADGQTLGEVVMRGNNVMAGYFDDPAATADAFRGGWFHSGDVAVMHPDGYIEIRDRAKDVIVSGGENISTVEIEQALAHHPAVREVAVVGVPDERWGERPKAFVVLRTAISAEELTTFLRGRIASYKLPREVEFVDDLPRTSTGKIQKFALREQEWQALDRRV